MPREIKPRIRNSKLRSTLVFILASALSYGFVRPERPDPHFPKGNGQVYSEFVFEPFEMDGKRISNWEQIAGKLYAQDIEECQGYYGENVRIPCLRPNIHMGVIKTNSQNTYGEEIVLPKPRGVFRVAALGGSTTAGYRSPKIISAWPEILEEKLNAQNDGVKYEVINYGVVGGDSRNVTHRMENEVVNHEVDLAIVDLGWNDVKRCRILGEGPNEELMRRAYTLSLREGFELPWFNEQRAFWKERILDRSNKVVSLALLNGKGIGSYSDFERASEAYIEQWSKAVSNPENDNDKFLKRVDYFDKTNPFANVPEDVMVESEFGRSLVKIVRVANAHRITPALLTETGRVGRPDSFPLPGQECGSYELAAEDKVAFIMGSLPRLLYYVGAHEGADVIDTAKRWESINKNDYYIDVEHHSLEGNIKEAKWMAPYVTDKAHAKLGIKTQDDKNNP